MQNVIPGIQKRQDNMMVSHAWKGKKRFNSEGSSKTSSVDEVESLPSVLDRLRSLYRVMSSSHSMYSLIGQLIKSLDQGEEDGDDTGQEGEITLKQQEGSDVENSFHLLFASFRKMLSTHRLHSLILQSVLRCTMITGQQKCENQRCWHRLHDSGNAVDLHFDQYLGDVYIVYILLGNISSGLVEGVSEKKWLQSLNADWNESELTDTSQMPPFEARVWYRSWIFLHSTLLRSTPLTSDEMTLFGLLRNGNFITRTEIHHPEGNEENISLSAKPFQGLYKTGTMLQLYTRLTCDGTLDVLMRDFGTLGPSFRGR